MNATKSVLTLAEPELTDAAIDLAIVKQGHEIELALAAIRSGVPAAGFAVDDKNFLPSAMGCLPQNPEINTP